MEVLGLDVKREHVRQKHSEGGRNILGGVGAEIARRVERRLAALSRVLYTHFGPSFRVDAVVLFAEHGSEQMEFARAAAPSLQVACLAAPRIEHRRSRVCSLPRAKIEPILTWLSARRCSLAGRRSRRE